MGFNIYQCFIKFLFLSFLFPVILLSQPTQANAIEIEHTLGFNGVFRLKDWTPFTVVLENRHQRIQGQLEVVVTSGSEYQNDVYHTIYSTEVDLPTYSRKTYTLTIFIDSYVHPLSIQLKKENKIIFSKSINLRKHFVTKPLLIITEENLKGPVPLITEEYQTVFTPIRFLPENWVGYHGVKGLILKAGMWKNLQPRQYQAITQWIKSGGFVITTGSLYENSLSQERLEPLLSIRVVGLERVRELPALQAFCGTKLTSREPFLLLKLRAPQAETVLRERDLALILEKGLGLGKVLFFAFDVTEAPFRNWSGREAFWEKIVHLAPVAETTPWEPEDQKIISYLQSKMSTRFPFFFLVFPFLVGYLLLVTLLMKRIRENREKALKTLAYLTLAIFFCSLTGFGFNFHTQIQNKLSFNGLLHLKISGLHGLSRWKYLLGIYSQKDGNLKLPLGSDNWMVTVLPTENPDTEKFQSYTLHESQEASSLEFPLYRWSNRLFSLSGYREFPIQAKASFHEQDLVLAVENRSAFPIKDCHIYFRGRLYVFGPIAPRDKLVKSLKQKVSDPKQVFTDKAIEAFLKADLGDGFGSLIKEIQMELTKTLLISIHKRDQKKEDKVFLVGWIDSRLFTADLKDKTPFRDGAGLLEWEIPLETQPGI
jgi:hypothetical protein